VIRFRSLELTNFHLAQAVKIPFSLDRDRPLTVIRAEPGTGKTTVFRAFRWVLYGDPGLPNDGRDYALGSLGRLNEVDGDELEVAVMLEFETDEEGVEPSVYRLRRSTVEQCLPDGKRSHRSPSVILMRRGPGGWMPVDYPEPKMLQLFPPELRDVFFTDGDEAMRFIAKDVSTDTKRKRVQGAIRNLMGLNILDAALGHLNDVGSLFNREVRSKGGQSVKDAGAQVERLEHELGDVIAKESMLAGQVADLEERRSSARERRDAALQRGNRTELQRELSDAEASLKAGQDEESAVAREKADILRSRDIAVPFIADHLEHARRRLHSLKEEGAIPSDYLPLLRERLQIGQCVCGASLATGTTGRDQVEKLLDQQVLQTGFKERLTRLYYSSDAPLDPQALTGPLRRLEQRLERARQQQTTSGMRVRAAEARMAQLGDSDLEQLQGQLDQYDKTLSTVSHQHGIAVEQARQKRQELDEAKRMRDKLLEHEAEARLVRAKLTVAQDLLQVLSGAETWIRNEKLAEVSREMDRLFREMIGQDFDEALITKTEITPDFDVAVYSRSGAKLDPDLQLNGASRRAITLAFILALAKVSRVKSPNVIDTPLGMMGIQVKQAALRTLVAESAQPILFLTFAEIRDIEAALDRYAGEEVTLTLTSHYPTYLANKPPTEEPEILVCMCGHATSCQLCERVFTSADLALTLPEGTAA
jgi:DNA sulfur modification protein DndD